MVTAQTFNAVGNGIDTIVYSLSVDNYTASEINKSIIVTPIDQVLVGQIH